MTMTYGINPLTKSNITHATDLNLTHGQKMQRISECKISVCYNNFPVRNHADLANIKSQPSWTGNAAFSHIDSLGIIPQLKSRFIEASLSKTLNLVEEDPWNVVEDWYTPGEHFIYFHGNEDLDLKIKKILDNWPHYLGVIENSYHHSLNHYTCDHLIHRIESNEMSLL